MAEKLSSTPSSTAPVIDITTRERMAAPVADVRIGHNNPPADLDMARAYRWAICKSELTPTASLIAHTIGVLFDDTGSPVWPSIRWISEHSRIPIGTVKYYMPEVRGWRDLAVGKARGRRGNTYKVNVDVDMVRAEYAAWEEDRCRLAGQPSYPSNKAAGQSAYPPKPQNAVAGQPSYPSTPSRITNSENPPVAGQQNPVAGQPGLSATKIKESQSSQSHSEQGPSQINVVSISADVEVKNRLLKVFGPGLMPSAQRLATFLQCDVQSALGTMDAYQGSVSPGVVLNAIAKLDLNAMHKGHPIQDRAKWFENGIGFAKADADGAWLEAPKKERRDRPMRNGYPVNSDGKNIFEMFGYDTPTGGAG